MAKASSRKKEKTDWFLSFFQYFYVVSPLTYFFFWLKISFIYKHGYSKEEVSDNSNYHRTYYPAI